MNLRLVLFASCLLAFAASCADDDGTVVDSGPPTDTSVGDTAMDAAPDSSTTDSSTDSGPTDAASDAPPTDADSDTAVDAGSCGTMPACAADETCWGEACSCIQEIDGDSYLRTDGTAFFHQRTPHVVAESAPGTPLGGIVEIMDGWRHTCGLIDDGTVWCWGKSTTGDMFGELGDGTIGGATTAFMASQVLTGPGVPLTGIAHLSNRSSSRCYIESTTCGIRGSDGAVFCWGVDNAGGGTGSFFTEGSVANRPYATQLMASDGVPLTDIVQVAIGIRHACAINTAGDVLCWGMSVTGSLGLGDQLEKRYPTTVPLPGGARADQVGAGSDFTCVRSGDAVFCWGASGFGAVGLGDPSTPENHDGCINFCHMTPIAVIDGSDAPLAGAVDLEVHYLGACARLADHTLRCWGDAVGNVATEPSIGGAPLTNVAQMTSCSSNDITMAIRYMQRDGSLHDRTREIEPVCD